MIKAVLFDLDGTLIPMDLKVFTKVYLSELAKVLCPLGIEENLLFKAMLSGMKAMRLNDGRNPNEEVFWNSFVYETGIDRELYKQRSIPFYDNEFNNVKVCTKPNELAPLAIALAKSNGRKVVLATNPFFPLNAQINRAAWVGIDASDFDIITSYEKEYFCKPNPSYFTSICERLGFAPEECLMVGNDVNDDMIPAKKAGLDTYLVTDWVILKEGYKWEGKSGNFQELIEYLKNL